MTPTGAKSITFGVGFTHDLGTLCRHCGLTEARCARLGVCCLACSHFRVTCTSKRASVELTPNGWAVRCLHCRCSTSPFRLLSEALANSCCGYACDLPVDSRDIAGHPFHNNEVGPHIRLMEVAS